MRACKNLASILFLALLTFVSIAAILLLPFTNPPRPHRVTGILFGPGFDARQGLILMADADPNIRFLDSRWHGRLVYVLYDAIGFPDAVRRSGALYIFDAVSAGCHTANKH